MMIERKKSGEDIWVHESKPQRKTRDYSFFALLAGVTENDEQPLFPLRGIPDDASERFKEACLTYENDAHSHGWLTYDEYRQVLDSYNIHCQNHKLNGINLDYLNVCSDMHDIIDEGHEARVCFFFDN